MKYFLDTEFDEDGSTIRLISIAIVSSDGRELYCVNSEVRIEDCSAWVQTNVWPLLYTAPAHTTRRDGIRSLIEDFVRGDKSPEFWGYYADYDWVVFCWLWGAMLRLPPHFPKHCMDLQQEASRLGVQLKELVPHAGPAHNALSDARWNAAAYAALASRREDRERDRASIAAVLHKQDVLL